MHGKTTINIRAVAGHVKGEFRNIGFVEYEQVVNLTTARILAERKVLQ